LTERLDSEIRDTEAEKVKEAIDFAVGSPEPEPIDAHVGVFVEDD
jgi:TPP-dependent pyruvate/acetoin dehydrogenase alpha subunit